MMWFWLVKSEYLRLDIFQIIKFWIYFEIAISILFITLEIASLMNLVHVYSSRIEIYLLDFTWIIFQRISWHNIPRDIHVKSISCLGHMKKK